MVMELIQIEEIIRNGRSRDANSENWGRNPGQGSDGNQNNKSSVRNQQTLNNDSGGNRYRTNSSDKNNLI